jgi:bifunctional non-homologous end joining protein LigD
VLDGEVIVPDARGAADFHALQNDLARKRSDRLIYYVFDLLYLDGRDYRDVPLIERKRTLAKLLSDAPAPLRLSEHFDVNGEEMFQRVCDMQLEGIISKQRNSTYRSGRVETWLKSKCTKTDAYPIIAFVEKLGAKPRRVASLYIGRREGERLLYAGKVKTGYTEFAASELRERLDPLIRKTTPLSQPIKKPKATWVEPQVLAEVEFSSITSDGLLREAVYKGMRDDLADEPLPIARRNKGSKPAVPRENILQLLPDAVPPTKEVLAQYWTRIADRALEHLAERPLKLVRHVHGTTFYHKGRLPPIPSSVHQLKIAKREGGEGTRLWIDDLEGLLGLVEIGAVELHPWNSTIDDIEKADRLVFDFDPGEGVDYAFVIASALAMREVLLAEGLESWPKLSGGKGIHVMAPLAKKMTHDDAHKYARQLAQRLLAVDRTRYTLSAALHERPGKLFIDVLRNGRGTTAIGTYSPRARPGFPIAAPVSWRDVERGIEPDAFNMQRLPTIKRAAPTKRTAARAEKKS